MRITYAGTNVEVTDALREITEKKMSKLDKYFDKDIEAYVTYSTQKDSKTIEVTIDLLGTIIRAEESSNDMYVSIDKVVDILERQVRKHKAKLQDRYRNAKTKTIRFENITPLEKKDEDEGSKIVRTKQFFLKPMNSEEAVLQMELLGHNFFIFMDGDTGSVNIVYKRKDGNYGLIEPEI